jgi:hypothetical protein
LISSVFTSSGKGLLEKYRLAVIAVILAIL